MDRLTIEEKEAFLRSYRECDVRMMTIQQEIDSLRSTVLVKGYHMSDLPKHHNNTDDKMADYAEAHLKLCNKMKRNEDRKLAVIDSLNELSDRDAESAYILASMYISGKSKIDIEKELNISKGTRIRKYRKAIELLNVNKG